MPAIPDTVCFPFSPIRDPFRPSPNDEVFSDVKPYGALSESAKTHVDTSVAFLLIRPCPPAHNPVYLRERLWTTEPNGPGECPESDRCEEPVPASRPIRPSTSLNLAAKLRPPAQTFQCRSVRCESPRPCPEVPLRASSRWSSSSTSAVPAQPASQRPPA